MCHAAKPCAPLRHVCTADSHTNFTPPGWLCTHLCSGKWQLPKLASASPTSSTDCSSNSSGSLVHAADASTAAAPATHAGQHARRMVSVCLSVLHPARMRAAATRPSTHTQQQQRPPAQHTHTHTRTCAAACSACALAASPSSCPPCSSSHGLLRLRRLLRARFAAALSPLLLPPRRPPAPQPWRGCAGGPGAQARVVAGGVSHCCCAGLPGTHRQRGMSGRGVVAVRTRDLLRVARGAAVVVC